MEGGELQGEDGTRKGPQTKKYRHDLEAEKGK